MSCRLVAPESPFNAASVACSILGAIICSVCLYHSFQEHRSPSLDRDCAESSHEKTQRDVIATKQLENNGLVRLVPNRNTRPSLSLLPWRACFQSGPSALRQLWKIQFSTQSRQFGHHTQVINLYLRVLLQLSWIVLFADSICNLGFVFTVIWSCPQYNCLLIHILKSDNCMSGAFIHAQAILQPLASAIFALATMNRFVGVYSILSIWRYRLLRVGSFLVVLVTVVRLATFGARSYTFYSYGVDVKWLAVVRMLDDTAYYAMWSILGLLEVTSLTIGLQHVLSVRAELDSVMSTQPGHLQGSLPILALADGSSNPSQHAQFPSFAFRNDSKGASGEKDAQRTIQAIQPYRKQTTRVLACIALNALLLLVLFVGNVPAIQQSFPATFVFTIMTLFLKMFAVATTVAIHITTKFVVSRPENISQALPT